MLNAMRWLKSGLETDWTALALMLALAAAAWGQGGPPGGSIADLLISPNDPNVIFAATPSGVFRSDNRGGSWRSINEGLTVLDVEAVAESPEYLYAATFGGGIFRSADGGTSWSASNQGLDNLFAQSIAVAPSDPNVLYAGFFTGATMTGAIFKSTDAGNTWAAVRNGLTDGSYLDIAIHPANPDIVYAANTRATSPNAGALFRTTNGGTSWQGSGADGVTAVAIDASAPDTVYAGTVSSLVKTTNGGASFQPLLTNLTVRDLAVDPKNSQAVYAGTRLSSLIVSTNGGANWEAAGAGLPQAEVLSVAIDTANSSRVFAGLDASGVFVSTDAAESWVLSSTGLHAADVGAIAIDPNNSRTVYASVFGGMIFKTTDGGLTWTEARKNLTATNVVDLAVAAPNSNTVYATSISPFVSQVFGGDGALFQSTDAGGDWGSVLSGAPVTRVLPHPTNLSTIFVGTNQGVFRTTTGVAGFQGRSNGLGINRIADLAYDPANPDNLFAVGFDSGFQVYGMYRTTNSGGDWMSSGATALPLLAVAVDPNDRNRVYVGGRTGVFRSTNRGESFNPASQGLPASTQVNSVVIDGHSSSEIYVASAEVDTGNSAIYKSANRGDSWAQANNGLGNRFVRRLAIDRSQAGVLWAATAGFGVYKTTDGGANWVPAGVAPGDVPFVNAGGIVGAFDASGGGVAPGAIVSIFGQKMGPAEGVLGSLDSGTGKVATKVSGVRVLFNGREAALFFVRADQINAQVPFEVSGLSSVEVVVEYNGVPSAPAVAGVVETHPELHPNMVNFAASTINSTTNRIAKGGVVLLFATGQGLVDPAIESGALAPGAEPFPRPRLPVAVTVGGIPAEVFFSGLAPGFAGLLQVNIFVPQGAATGPNQVVLKIGDRTAAVSRMLFVE